MLIYNQIFVKMRLIPDGRKRVLTKEPDELNT